MIAAFITCIVVALATCAALTRHSLRDRDRFYALLKAAQQARLALAYASHRDPALDPAYNELDAAIAAATGTNPHPVTNEEGFEV